VAPKRQYSFEDMLDDILDFAAEMLVDDGRLGIWIPTAGDEGEVPIPQCAYLAVCSVCTQIFNKCWCAQLIDVCLYSQGPGGL
jgi:tRNA (guanine10-N2)-methyltransferase